MDVRHATCLAVLIIASCGDSADSDTTGSSGAGAGSAAAGTGGSSASTGAAAGASSASAGGSGTGTAAGGAGGATGCASGKYLLCEDFESTAPGSIPAGWQFPQNSQATPDNVRVADDQAHGGAHALEVDPSLYQTGIVTDGSRLGGAHWGRIFYRVAVPVPPYFVHTTAVFLHGDGPVNGSEEVRVVGTVQQAEGPHQFLYNVQPNGAEFGTGSPYDWTFDGMWHCAEWHIDSAVQSYHFYFDGDEVSSIAIDNGAGNFGGSDIPSSFDQIFVGWSQYQTPPDGQVMPQRYTVWLDDVAIGDQRVGCSP